MKKQDFHNAGQTRDEILQNHFTACLRTSLQRERKRYLYCRNREKEMLQNQSEYEWFDPNYGRLDMPEPQTVESRQPRSWEDFLQEVETEWLLKILHSLSDEETDILYWHIILNLRYAEIQQLTGIPIAKAQLRYSSAIRKIRTALMRGEQRK